MKLLKEPLLHFAIAGALLFAGYSFFDQVETAPDAADPVRVGAGEVRWLEETFASQWQRAPTSEELSALAANLVEEELLAREARSLGLDQDDTIVRRRLAQKLSFLIEDTGRLVEPTEDDLRRFYSANIDRFQTAPRVSFTQIFFSTDGRRQAKADAEAALIAISATGGGADLAVMGDATMLEESFQDIDRQALSSMFGVEFADATFDLKPGSWHGPINSSFGLHLVEVTHVRPAESQPFEAIRADVAEEWRRGREDEIKKSYLANLRLKYGIVVADSVKPLLAPEASKSAAQ